jgi:hypothetical protein
MSVEYAEDDDSGGRWTESPENMRIRRSLASRVDSDLSRNEQETGISFFGDSTQFTITTYRRSIVRAILKHEHAAIDWLFEHPDESNGGRVDFPLADTDPNTLRKIEGVSASLPLGTLSIKGSPRQSDTQSAIVSTPENARAVAAAFNGGESK